MVKKRSRVTGRAEKGESWSWTDCDRDFKVVCEMLARFFLFYFILFFSILQERTAGVGCFSHVWSLLSRAMLFSAMQRVWLLARENEKGGRNKDRIKTEKAFDSKTAQFDTFLWTLVGLHHFNTEANWLWNVSLLCCDIKQTGILYLQLHLACVWASVGLVCKLRKSDFTKSSPPSARHLGCTLRSIHF